MRRFRNVVITIIASISILFVFNLFYLRGLFQSMEEDTKRTVLTCFQEADNKELQIRLAQLSQNSDYRRCIAIDQSFSWDSISTNGFTQTTTRSTIHKNDTAVKVRSEKSPVNLTAFGLLVKEISSVIHQNIDTIKPVNLQLLDSLFTIELKNKGIHSELFYTDIIDFKQDTVIKSSLKKSRSLPGNYTFSYLFDQENKYAYKVHMASLTGIVLRQMSGILISTFLIILLLGLAFWYLIRTVMQQKTLEEMKDDFTNNMTHELKTPIAVAFSAADTLLNFRQGENREKREKYLRICVEQLAHLNGLVEQILSISMEKRKAMKIRKEQIEVKAIIHQQTSLHQLKSDKEITFIISIEPEDMTMYADSLHLNNIIGNLVDNAIKYSADKAVIEISAYQEKEFSVLVIKDNGIGIAPANLQHIFEKFYRVPSGNLHNIKGYGLGLFYVKQVIEKHKGQISAKSVLNKGTAFTLKLPKE